jgi:hypothetical protein
MTGENNHHRLLFANHLRENSETRSTSAIAQLAIFDINADVRKFAIQSLRERPGSEYRPLLMKALRYPWAPIARHAAQVIVELDLHQTIPDLAAMLEEPDPTAPFVVKTTDAKPKTMVRELVRVNHHRNCMLCHAPVSSADRNEQFLLRALPVGPVPSAQDPLPASASPVYYSLQKGGTVVRADITYLRQDFSVQQKVDNHGKWPEMQRFDFFVRTIELTEQQAAARKPAAGLSEFHATIMATLQALTGQAHAPNSAAWRNEVQMSHLFGDSKKHQSR